MVARMARTDLTAGRRIAWRHAATSATPTLRQWLRPPALREQIETERLVGAIMVRMRRATPALAGALAGGEWALESTAPNTMLVRFHEHLPELTALNRVARLLRQAVVQGQVPSEGDVPWTVLLAVVPAFAGVDCAPAWWLRAF